MTSMAVDASEGQMIERTAPALVTHVHFALHPADVANPDDLLEQVREWPGRWRDEYEERRAILEVEAGHVWATAIRTAFKMTLEAASIEGIELRESSPESAPG